MAFLIPVFFVTFILFVSSVKVIKEFERGIVYTFGKYTGTIAPGLRLILPVVQQMVIVDVRVRTESIPPQDVISKDNVSVKVNAVVYYRVIDADKAVNQIEDFNQATSQLAQTTLRSVLGKQDMDDMLSNREELNKDIQEILDHQTENWGIKISHVEIKNIDLDPSMVRAMAKQAEAERERRAKIINAQGELEASKQLDEAAEVLARRPETMQLRYLGTLGEFVNAKGSTIVLPMPMDLLKGVTELAKIKK